MPASLTRKLRRWSLPWALALGCGTSALLLATATRPASAVPNCCEGAPKIAPDDSDIPHEHSPETVKRGVLANALLDVAPAGDHNHRDKDEWQVVNGNVCEEKRWNFCEPKKQSRAWDNRSMRTNPDLFDKGHGFVDWRGYGFRPANPNTIRYRFGRANGTDVPTKPMRDAIKKLVKQFEKLDHPDRNFTTGIRFEKVPKGTPDANVEIEVLGRPIAALGDTGPGGPALQIRFDKGSAFHFGPKVTTPEPNKITGLGGKYHFATTVLHEFGHALGLKHTIQGGGAKEGKSGMMARKLKRGCKTHSLCYDEIDEQSKHGLFDMYSIPTPDFGDAPDDPKVAGDFPSLLVSDGARAPTLYWELLGPAFVDKNRTTREKDARIVKSDEKDDDCVLRKEGENHFLRYSVAVRDHTDARYTDGTAADDLFVAAWADIDKNSQWTPLDDNIGNLLFVHGLDPQGWPIGTDTAKVTTYAGTAPSAVSGAADATVVDVPVAAGVAAKGVWRRCRLVYGVPPGAPDYLKGDLGDEGLVPFDHSIDNGGEIEDHLAGGKLAIRNDEIQVEFSPGPGSVSVDGAGLRPAVSIQVPSTLATVSGVSIAGVEMTGTVGVATLGPLNGGGPLTQNTLPVTGMLRLCIFDPTCTTFTEIPLTLSGTRGFGIGGATLVTTTPGGIRISLVGNPWTVATVTALDQTDNGLVTTCSASGFTHGPASGTLSASAVAGAVQLVTSAQVSTNIPGLEEIPLFGRITLTAVPEPGQLLLLASGALGLALLGRRRMKP
jgi:hypothetical protein